MNVTKCCIATIINKTNIEILLQNEERYIYFIQLLEAIHNGDIKDNTDQRLLLIQNFYDLSRKCSGIYSCKKLFML